jgi:glycine cleavage system regulatory protein
MYKIQNFSLVFKNKNGLFSNIVKNIYNLDGNILQSKYNKINDNSEFNFNISIPKKNTTHFNNYILDVNKYNLDNIHNNFYKVIINCSDNPGIIHSAIEKIEQINGNIIKMNSYSTKAPISNSDLFEIDITFTLKDDYFNYDIEKYLNNIKYKYNCELNVSKM